MVAGKALVLPAARDDCPSRLYAQPIRLQVGQRLDTERFAQLLAGMGYRPARESLDRGTFRQTEEGMVVMLRPWPVAGRHAPREGVRRLDLVLEEGRIARLLVDGIRDEDPEQVALPQLATLYSDYLIDCRPVDLATLPDHVALAIMAAEDDGFYQHGGLSGSAILRSAWVNLRNGAIVQGGSTITQQLVKNLYLTPEQSLSRKAREAFLALALETRYDKDEILTSYLNHAYWGRRGAIQIVGIEAGARSWFAKDAAELDLPEAALLAAMLRSPGAYDPVAHPARAQARRDWVLDLMRREGWIDPEQHLLARDQPIVISARRPEAQVAPYFVQWVRARLEGGLGIALQDGGYDVLTTLRYEDQVAAEAVLADGLPRLERRDVALQTALVSIDPVTGAVLSYVGGRDFTESQFDRAAVARRQLGSTFKPFVYAAAVEAGVARPADMVDDAPLVVAYGREYWMPRNDGPEFSGLVSVRSALVRSLNVPTVRIALATGIGSVRDLAARVGLTEASQEAVPSLALGTLETSALDLARAYAAFAAGGSAPQVNGVVAVYRHGRELPLSPSSTPVRLITAATAQRVTGMLQEVVQRGTAASMGRYGLRDPVAGKTGTSDDLRDAWFAGYSPDRVTVVWVGRDDNKNAGHYGAQAALPLWAQYMLAVRPEGGYQDWDHPVEAPGDHQTSTASTPTLAETILRPDRREWSAMPVAAADPDRVSYETRRHVFDTRRHSFDGGYITVEARSDASASSLPTLPANGAAGIGVEDPAGRQSRLMNRLNLWRDMPLLTAAVRVFEVPDWFRLPCTKQGQASTGDDDPCTAVPRAPADRIWLTSGVGPASNVPDHASRVAGGL